VQKCKEIGMKTSWVLSEDDKSKLNAARKLGGSPKEEEEIRVKKVWLFTEILCKIIVCNTVALFRNSINAHGLL
jgi:hypothetical protein